MKKFRLPRKIKKKLKGLYLYPADEKGGSLAAWPKRSQEDYDALKKGIVRNLNDKKNSKAKRKEYREKMFAPIEISDKKLKEAVDYIFAEEYKETSYKTLLKAKEHPVAIESYYAFVNAYNLVLNGESSYGNVCCMTIDSAESEMKVPYKKKK